MTWTRREFVKVGGVGFATVGGGLWLPDGVLPTASSGEMGEFAAVAAQQPNPATAVPQPTPPANLTPTEDNILGPYHRPRAPYRAKITPPLEPGTVLLIRGRVWGTDTRRPLAGATVDIWQANAQGRYDNDDPARPPAPDVFVNRARLFTDETGAYEYETIHPGAYRIGPNTWRPPHIHYLVRAAGYRELITQLYFRGDPHQRTDNWIKESLIIELREQRVGQATFKTGTFDIVLPPLARR